MGNTERKITDEKEVRYIEAGWRIICKLRDGRMIIKEK